MRKIEKFTEEELRIIRAVLSIEKTIDETETEIREQELNLNFIDILPIIPNPHITEKQKTDPLSLIYSNFITKTDIPPALPVFTF